MDAWRKETYTLAVRDCHAFCATLPDLRQQVDANQTGDPSDVLEGRRTVLDVCEGISLWARVELDAAELALNRTLESLESRVGRATRPGLARFLRRLVGACRTGLGHVAHSRGDHAEALRAYLKVRDIAHRSLRDFASARLMLEGAIDVFRRHGWKGEELDATVRLAMGMIRRNG